MTERSSLSRRGVLATAAGGLVLAQAARAAIVRTDIASLRPLPLPSGIRSRVITNVNGLNVHILEAGTRRRIARRC